MVYCFAPTCSHSSESHTCKFFAFPSDKKEKDQYKRWIRLIRLVTALTILNNSKNIIKFGDVLWACDFHRLECWSYFDKMSDEQSHAVSSLWVLSKSSFFAFAFPSILNFEKTLNTTLLTCVCFQNVEIFSEHISMFVLWKGLLIYIICFKSFSGGLQELLFNYLNVIWVI